MKKRGQVVIFMVLGIVLLIAFGFIFFVRNIFFQAEIDSETQSKLSDVFRSDVFYTYVSSCLDEVSKEAIMLIGKQGGNFYEDQGGSIPKTRVFPMNDYYVSYGITWEPENPDFLPVGSYTSFPEYPRQDDIMKVSYFGNNNLPYLCQVDGPNQELKGGIRNETCTIIERRTGDFTFKDGYGPNSIQEQLSDYIKKNIKTCINLSEVPELSGLILEEGEYNITVIFGREDVIVEASIPVVAIENNQRVIREPKFSTQIKIRLKQVYDLAYFIVERDRRRLNFVKDASQYSDFMTKTLPNSGRFKQGFSLDIVKPYSNHNEDLGYNHDTLIIITDAYSKIGTESFVFMFAIENRPPVLDRIHSPHAFTEAPLSKYDFIVGTSSKIHFKAQGYDPDEGDLFYAYSGWREDFYTEFDYECCVNIDCRNRFQECVNKLDPIPRGEIKWTDSEEYLDTEREASYTTTLTDVGSHNVTVTVSDQGNLTDWQEVSILVVDTPVGFAEGYNNYQGIDNSKASLEDPYYLDASQSVSLILPLVIFNWYDVTEPFDFEGLQEPVLRLPYYDFNIENIKDKNSFTRLGTHWIHMTTSNKVSFSDTYIFNATVHQCLPHRNPSSPPWPYNTVSDPFMADHTCCNDDFTYADTNKICYTYVEYGTIEYFRENPLTIPGAEGIVQEEIDVPSGYGYQNNVYRRTFTRKCSGDRGNTCTGDVRITIELVESCHNECERPYNFLTSQQPPVRNPISCQSTGIYHYTQIEGTGYTTLEGTRCDDCGHLCEREGYWFQPPCCVCLHEPNAECEPGYTPLGPTLEVIPPYSCTMCCVLETEECEHDYS